MNNLIKTSSLGAAVLAALLPLVCCWGPALLAGIAVISGAATKMAWLHPYENWLYGVSFITLGYSHISAYKSRQAEAKQCQCSSTNSKLTQATNKYSGIALWGATGLVVIMFLLNQFPD